MKSDPFQFLVNAAHRYGGIVRLPAGPRPFQAVMHLVAAPEAIHQVLVTNRSNYPKSMTYEPVRYIVGDGLLTSEGERWKRDRRGLQPLLTPASALAFTPLFNEAADDLAVRWRVAAASGRPIDLDADMAQLTLDVIGRALFHLDVAQDAGEIGEALTQLLRDTDDRMTSLAGVFTLWNRFLPTPANIRARRSLRRLHRVAARLLDSRRGDGPQGPDLISTLASMGREADGPTPREVIDQILTFVLAGHETTATTLTFAWHLLSRDAAVGDRVAAEVLATAGATAITAEHRSALRYTDAVVRETLRLYPPAWVLERDAIEEDVLGGYAIPAKSIVIVSPYVTHRLDWLWDGPEDFVPERFLETEGPVEHSYLPFGLEPRHCIGSAFASWEAVVLLAKLAAEFSLEPLPGFRS